MPPPGFICVARSTEIPDGKSKKISVGQTEVALWHVNGEFYAVNNVCPHQHFSVLHQAQLNGLCITCPMHGWTYSLATGRAIEGDGLAQTYDVLVDGIDIYIDAEKCET